MARPSPAAATAPGAMVADEEARAVSPRRTVTFGGADAEQTTSEPWTTRARAVSIKVLKRGKRSSSPEETQLAAALVAALEDDGKSDKKASVVKSLHRKSLELDGLLQEPLQVAARSDVMECREVEVQFEGGEEVTEVEEVVETVETVKVKRHRKPVALQLLRKQRTRSLLPVTVENDQATRSLASDDRSLPPAKGERTAESVFLPEAPVQDAQDGPLRPAIKKASRARSPSLSKEAALANLQRWLRPKSPDKNRSVGKHPISHVSVTPRHPPLSYCVAAARPPPVTIPPTPPRRSYSPMRGMPFSPGRGRSEMIDPALAAALAAGVRAGSSNGPRARSEPHSEVFPAAEGAVASRALGAGHPQGPAQRGRAKEATQRHQVYTNASPPPGLGASDAPRQQNVIAPHGVASGRAPEQALGELPEPCTDSSALQSVPEVRAPSHPKASEMSAAQQVPGAKAMREVFRALAEVPQSTGPSSKRRDMFQAVQGA